MSPPTALGLSGSTQLQLTFSSSGSASSVNSLELDQQVTRATGLRTHLKEITWLAGDPELIYRLLREAFTFFQYATSHQEIVEVIRRVATTTYLRPLTDADDSASASDTDLRALDLGLQSFLCDM